MDGTRWTGSFPRKGWTEVCVYDTGEYPGGECEACGTEYRYEHELFHEAEKFSMNVGCICAEHLTEDYVNPRKREQRLKYKRKKPQINLVWKEARNGSLYSDNTGIVFIVFVTKDHKIMLRIGRILGKLSFPDFKSAQARAQLWYESALRKGFKPTVTQRELPL